MRNTRRGTRGITVQVRNNVTGRRIAKPYTGGVNYARCTVMGIRVRYYRIRALKSSAIEKDDFLRASILCLDARESSYDITRRLF